MEFLSRVNPKNWGTHKTNKILEMLKEAVINSSKFNEPFSHFHMDKVFTDEFYEELIENMPEEKHYDNFHHLDLKVSSEMDRSPRLHLHLTKEKIETFGAPKNTFWKLVHSALSNRELKTLICESLEEDFYIRFGSDFNTMNLYPAKIVLVKDSDQYQILPHQDSPLRFLTFQIYLPPDNDHHHLGTCFYEKRGKVFKKVKQFDFKPNSGYSFAVSDNSWHGVDQMKEEYTRNSIMLIYDIEDEKKKLNLGNEKKRQARLIERIRKYNP